MKVNYVNGNCSWIAKVTKEKYEGNNLVPAKGFSIHFTFKLNGHFLDSMLLLAFYSALESQSHFFHT